jgi:tripartite-type tricarboxylate transporter receptor subunit TctC
VSNSLPVKNMAEFIAYAKQNPGKISFGSSGVGSASHLSGALFQQMAGIDMLHVPYKGSGPAVVALLAGEVSLMFDSISTSLPQVKAGKLKALAVTSDTRSPLLPDVPTIQESGVPGFVVNGWYGILAPAGTPPAVVDKLSAAIADSLREPALREQLTGYGYTPIGSTPQAFGELIDSELARWSQAVKDSGATIQQ